MKPEPTRMMIVQALCHQQNHIYFEDTYPSDEIFQMAISTLENDGADVSRINIRLGVSTHYSDILFDCILNHLAVIIYNVENKSIWSIPNKQKIGFIRFRKALTDINLELSTLFIENGTVDEKMRKFNAIRSRLNKILTDYYQMFQKSGFVFIENLSDLPMVEQPYFLDNLYRTFRSAHIWLKISSDKDQTSTYMNRDPHPVIGMEMGADLFSIK